MRRGWIGAVALAAVVVVAVLVLREPPPPEDPAPPPAPPSRTEQAMRVRATGLEWRQIALPEAIEQVHKSAADVERAIFPVAGQDGTHQLVNNNGVVVARGKESLTATLEGARVVVHESDTGRVSTVDSATGAVTGEFAGPKTAVVAHAVGAVGVQVNDRCLEILDASTLKTVTLHCAPEGWAISLLTAEMEGVQWREAKPDVHCARWFQVTPPFVPQVLITGERSCRAAVLVRTADWELTADFPPYEVGVLTPGPLVARRDNREITLDTAALDVHACGGRIYWLSRPTDEQQGELVRWTPGDTKVEVLEVGTGSAAPSRCVNGVLNVVTYGGGRPRLWALDAP